MARSRQHRSWLLAISALAAGSLIAYIDSRPGWDDTGITVGLILLSAGVLGIFVPRRAWLMAVLVGGVTPLVEIPAGHGAGSLAALAVAVGASYVGAGLRLLVRYQRPPADADQRRGI
jgi:hypothetical protein